MQQADAEPDSAAGRGAELVLLAITVAGAAVRFALLGRPNLWGDEALVYWRTCGTYAQLLRPLHADGFPPLHYELYWVIVRLLGHVPGPAAMRVVPAACGTLLVPAVYGLARQLLPRRTSLWAAAVTAGNAFALFYSRDAKMWGEAWLAMTVGVASLLAWLRTGSLTAWLGWVAAGAAAGGLATLTLVPVIGLSPLLLVTQRRAHWRQLGPWLAGVALIAAGPVGYYARFNVWTENVADQGWGDSGLGWVSAYNYGRTGPQLVRFLTTTFLTGWEWPRPVAFDHMPAARGWLLEGGAVAVLAVVAAGLLPWPRRWRPSDGIAPEPPWRTALWLAAWVVLPVYGFYCRSMHGFATPADAWAAHPRGWTATATVAIGVVTAGLVYGRTRAATRRWASLAVVGLAVVGGCEAIGRATTAGPSVWVPRYLGFVWPAVAVMTGAALARLPTRTGRAAALVLVVSVNLGMTAFRIFGSTEPPVDRMAADAWAGRTPDTLTWLALGGASGGNGGGHLFSDAGRYYLQLQSREPTSPDGFKRSLLDYRRRGSAAVGLPAVVTPAVRRVIVWEQAGRPDVDRDPAVGLPGWHLVADQAWVVRDVWTGQDSTRYRRREYRRAG